ncbi:MAG TPA: hypothetical protein VG028_19940 [Terriglobia bacterium]|nr:hypothetical protein [Terriglobia bacterium]
MSDDRKYRQRGYQDSGRDRSEKRTGHPQGPKPERFGPKTPALTGSHSVSRCGGCGVILPADFDPWGKCAKCGFELHSCKQCAYFDASSRWECSQPILARVEKKDARNKCTYYAARVTIEKQTKPNVGRPDDPRIAFENLFKK